MNFKIAMFKRIDSLSLEMGDIFYECCLMQILFQYKICFEQMFYKTNVILNKCYLERILFRSYVIYNKCYLELMLFRTNMYRRNVVYNKYI